MPRARDHARAAAPRRAGTTWLPSCLTSHRFEADELRNAFSLASEKVSVWSTHWVVFCGGLDTVDICHMLFVCRAMYECLFKWSRVNKNHPVDVPHTPAVRERRCRPRRSSSALSTTTRFGS